MVVNGTTQQPAKKRRRGEAAALAALLTGAGYRTAAREAGVSHRTMCRWMTPGDPFRAEYEAGKKRLMDDVRGRVVAHALEATDLLIERMRKGERWAIERVLSEAGDDDVDTRLTRLEAALLPEEAT